MFVRTGYLTWLAEMTRACALFKSPGRGGYLSLGPLELNPTPRDLHLCAQEAPSAVTKLERCRSEQQTLVIAETLIRQERHWLGTDFQNFPPMDGYLGGCRDSKLFFKEARRLFTRVDTLDAHGARVAAATLTLVAYALIGLGQRYRSSQQRLDECRICWFRNCVTGSHFCRIHRNSRGLVGQLNPNALRRKTSKLKKIFWEEEHKFRARNCFYLNGLTIHERGCEGLIIFNAVSNFSVAWLKEILSDCSNVGSSLGVEAINYVETENWADLFELLKLKIDPCDDRTNLDFWCAKLLQAEAWFIAENIIQGEWLEKPIYDRDGKILRSGQHVFGSRGPTKTTLQQMERIIALVRQGVGLDEVLTANGISQKVLRQWRVRHPPFATSLDFYIKRQERYSKAVVE